MSKPTLVEKMARAIRAEVERQGRLVGYVNSDEGMARAARDVMLAEMREPSEAMVLAGHLALEREARTLDRTMILHSATAIPTTWRTMLAAFEKEQGPA